MQARTSVFRSIPVVVALAASGLTGLAHAGRSCEARPLTPATLTRGLELAERTHNALEAEHARSGVRAVVLARAGQDLTKYGVRYSHLALVVRSSLEGQPAWRVLHKLNHCGTATSALYRQGLGEFFLDDLWRHEAAWVPLSPQVQQAAVALASDTQRLQRLHHRPYSIVSYAWGTRYQQSNQWLIETLGLALEPNIANRQQAQAWLQVRGYQPATLRLGPLTRLGGRMSSANVAFDDHPDAKRFTDRIETVTADSVFTWLQRSGLGGALNTLR